MYMYRLDIRSFTRRRADAATNTNNIMYSNDYIVLVDHMVAILCYQKPVTTVYQL